MENDRRKVLQNIAQKEQIAGILWIVVAVIQIIVGLFIYWVTLIIGVWNIIAGITRLTASRKIEERNNIVEEYEKSLTSTIIFIVINVLIGGVIGIVGAICDLVTRSYVLSNKDIINGVSGSSKASSSNGSKYEDLEKLQKLKENGILTEEEYAQEKMKILNERK